MSFWIYQEYQNNSYLQSYVNGSVQGGVDSAITFIAISSFTIAIALYAKLRGTRKELAGILSTATSRSDRRGHGLPVDTRAEQHLIEIVRKNTPIMNSGPGTDGPMPMLGRRDSQSLPEE